MTRKTKDGYVTQHCHIILGDKTIWHVYHKKGEQYWCGSTVGKSLTEQFKTLRGALEWLLK